MPVMNIGGNGGGLSGSGSGSGIDSSITSWAELQAVATVGLTLGATKMFVDTNNSLVTVVLRAGTDATDTANGVARPSDYNASTNAKVWLQVNT